MDRFLYIFIALSFAWSSIWMEGFYEGQFGKNYESDFFEWNMWNPNYYLETRLNGSPIEGSDFYVKFYADRDYERSENPLAVFSEGNV